MAISKRTFAPHFFEQNASYLLLVKAGLIECGATALFLFFTIGTITSGCRASNNAQAAGNSAGLAGVAPGSCVLQVSNITNIALAFGFSIFVLVYATAAYTGGHINPAVSLGFVIAGRISFVRGLLYTICQVLGATLGAALIRAVDPLAFTAIGGGANKLAVEVSYGQAWGMEAILTFSLVMMVFAATDNFHAAKVAHLPVLAPLAIGMTVFVCHLVAVPIDGCSINPARSFGPALAGNHWHGQWVFWVGPYAGAIVAALVYELVFRELPAVPEKKVMDIEEGDEKVASMASGKFPHITSGPEAGKAMPAQA